MSTPYTFLYPANLSPSMQEEMAERLRRYRATIVDQFLARAGEPAVLANLKARAADAQLFVSELYELAGRAPESLPSIMGNWGATLLMGLLARPDAHSEEQLSQRVGNLLAFLVSQRLERPSGEEVSFSTPATTYDLINGRTLEVRGPAGASPFRRILWTFSGETLSLREDGAAEPFARLPLPLRDGPVERAAPRRSKAWDVPILDSQVLGISGAHPDEAALEQHEDADWKPLPLEQSVDTAHGILRDLWPESITWAEVLLDAFVDINGPLSRSIHRSASYGAGGPLFLSRVDDPFAHAEDILHEMQHQRMALTFDTSAFGSWDDPRQRFVSPYRNDPRPPRGLHLGVHAFLAVNRLRIRALRDGRFHKSVKMNQVAKMHRTNLFSFRTLLEHEEIRPHGAPLLAEYARELASQHAEIEPLIPAEVKSMIDQKMQQHVDRVVQAAVATGGVLNAAPAYRDWDETAALAERYAREHGRAS